MAYINPYTMGLFGSQQPTMWDVLGQALGMGLGTLQDNKQGRDNEKATNVAAANDEIARQQAIINATDNMGDYNDEAGGYKMSAKQKQQWSDMGLQVPEGGVASQWLIDNIRKNATNSLQALKTYTNPDYSNTHSVSAGTFQTLPDYENSNNLVIPLPGNPSGGLNMNPGLLKQKLAGQEQASNAINTLTQQYINARPGLIHASYLQALGAPTSIANPTQVVVNDPTETDDTTDQYGNNVLSSAYAPKLTLLPSNNVVANVISKPGQGLL